MITGLTVLDSQWLGSRDLLWHNDPQAVGGYNIYRAFDIPTNWTKLNSVPLDGNFYRDISTLQQVIHTVQPYDWVEKGEFGRRYSFQIPDLPYAIINQGRPMIASSPDDVSILLNGTPYRPLSVSGIDKTISIQTEMTLPTGGAVSNFPIEGLAPITTVQCVYNKLVNFVDIYQSQVRTFYTVTSIGSNGSEIHPAGTLGLPVVNSQEVDHIDYMQREMVRRNSWIFQQTGEPAFLMLRKSRGVHCACSTPGEQPRSGCTSCYETGWIGGYYGPYDFLFIDPDTSLQTTVEEGGKRVDRVSRSFLGRSPVIQSGDMIVRRNGERLVIANPTHKQPRGVLLQQEFDVQLLNQGDTRYLIPITSNPTPVIYNPAPVRPFNPAFDPNPLDGKGGAEPLTHAGRNHPLEKPWDNPDPQTGRTVTFSNIQT